MNSIKKCSVSGISVKCCDLLGKSLDGTNPTSRSKGLFLPERVNVNSGEKGHDIVQLHSGLYIGRGIALNFCPFCGENIQTWKE